VAAGARSRSRADKAPPDAKTHGGSLAKSFLAHAQAEDLGRDARATDSPERFGRIHEDPRPTDTRRRLSVGRESAVPTTPLPLRSFMGVTDAVVMAGRGEECDRECKVHTRDRVMREIFEMTKSPESALE
jgi:hypothetical protein